jgi:hypothetical protein
MSISWSVLTKTQPETRPVLAQGHSSEWTRTVKMRWRSGSLRRIGTVLLFLGLGFLAACTPHQKHDHAVFGPADKGTGTDYGNNTP